MDKDFLRKQVASVITKFSFLGSNTHSWLDVIPRRGPAYAGSSVRVTWQLHVRVSDKKKWQISSFSGWISSPTGWSCLSASPARTTDTRSRWWRRRARTRSPPSWEDRCAGRCCLDEESLNHEKTSTNCSFWPLFLIKRVFGSEMSCVFIISIWGKTQKWNLWNACECILGLSPDTNSWKAVESSF